MKILYGIQGTGNGHITRARILAEAFSKRADVSVDYLFSGRQPDQYFDMQVFGQYRTFAGLTFVVENGCVKPIQTLQQAKLLKLIRDIRALDLSDYDLVLNDFEPLCAWAAKRQGVPSISISHQAAFNLDVPKEGDGIVDALLTKYFAPTTYELGTHWYHFGHNIIPPFVPSNLVRSCKIRDTSAHTLVYLPFEDTRHIYSTLHTLSDITFKCFHPAIKTAFKEHNIEWYPPSKKGFEEALITAKNVIGNAGFELATECMTLGKPLLVKPLQGQYEQFSNAKTLRAFGWSQTIYEFETDTVDEWLGNASASPVSFPSDPQVFIDWLVAGRWGETQEICDTLWQQVSFPLSMQRKLADLKVLKN